MRVALPSHGPFASCPPATPPSLPSSLLPQTHHLHSCYSCCPELSPLPAEHIFQDSPCPGSLLGLQGGSGHSRDHLPVWVLIVCVHCVPQPTPLGQAFLKGRGGTLCPGAWHRAGNRENEPEAPVDHWPDTGVRHCLQDLAEANAHHRCSLQDFQRHSEDIQVRQKLGGFWGVIDQCK